MTQSEKSAIIGMWRMGAANWQISNAMCIPQSEISEWIREYKKSLSYERRKINPLENLN